MIDCVSFQTGKRSVPKTTLKFRPTAYALVLHQGKLLLVKNRVTNMYSLPGGAIELGERMADTLHREVKEETGIDIEVGEFCHFEEGFFYYDPMHAAYHGLLFFFRCTPRSLEFSDRWHVDNVEGDPIWLDVAELSGDSVVLAETILGILASSGDLPNSPT